MATGDVKRKLTAIFSADVEGYSRLMGEDELATVETLTSYKETMGKLIRQHRGRVVDSTGDNLLAEFASVVDAVQCAVEVQQVLSAKNEALPEGRRMYFRIGINLGDVIEDEERIYGDGVNVAARVESLAEGGGISISGTAYDQLGKKLPLGYEYLGEQSVKNIEKPVRVYRVLTEAEAVGKVIGEKRPKPMPWRWAAVAAVIVILVAGVLAIWNFYFRSPRTEPASMERMAFPLPDKPSIAVLPFVNIGGEPEQEYFADGLTEEIITALSKVPRLFVIARNSSFIYKRKPVKVQQVSEDLGVQYVLEGSVRRSEKRVRITAQLVDALNGRHLWAEKYDRDLKDIFAVQDEITFEVIAALQVNLTEGEQALIVAQRTNNFEAYTKFLQGLEHVKRFNKEGNLLGRKMAEEAIGLDPNYPRGYRLLATTHMLEVWLGISESPKESLAKAAELYRRVIAMDLTDAAAHGFLGMVYTLMRQHEKGLTEAQKAVAINPNAADAHSAYGNILRLNGMHEEAVDAIKKAVRLNPLPPTWYWHNLGYACCHAGMYEEAIAAHKNALRLKPDNQLAHVGLAVSYWQSGREEEARAEVEEVLRLNPKFCVERITKGWPYKNQSDKDLIVSALRKAGLPESPPLPLPDKPSIAVLPFVNMSGDPEQQYFSDGIAEEIITALSKTPKLFVIARTSSFKYKGKKVDVRSVGRELGVRHVLEGSVRRAGDKVRITAQLIDAKTNQHLWAERYDRQMKDIFAIQDEITMKIITALQVKLTEGEQIRMWAKQYENLDVYLKHMEARSLWAEGKKESLIRFGQVAQEVIDMAPESALGYKLLAWYYWGLGFRGKSPRESIAKAFKLAQKALPMDESDSTIHALLGSVYLLMRKYEKAIAAGERSVELDPNGAMVHALLGYTLSCVGKPDEAIAHLKQGIRLNPFPPYWYFLHLARCYRKKGKYEEALEECKKAVRLAPDSLLTQLSITGTYSLLNREEEARFAAAKVLEIDPNFSVERFSKRLPYKNKADLKHVVDALRKAGLK
jgi:adenylate cyclase